MNAISGTFTYPPQDSDLQFDYSDSVVTSWVTNDSYPTEAVLTLWYYQTNWTISMSTHHLFSTVQRYNLGSMSIANIGN